MIKVSIIMPVYNAETTVSRMIDSILAQSMSDWELICIDDGSTDKSGMILDDYASNDNRIRVFHKENEGVAMARQMGVDNAKGEYSIQADADDWVEPTMLEDMYNMAESEQSQIVIADYYLHSGNEVSIVCQKPNNLNPNDVLTEILRGKLFGGLWHKLIRTDIYARYNVRFFEGVNYFEDLIACIQILRNPDIQISYIDKAYYHYICNSASITHKITRKTYEGLKLANEKIQFFLSGYDQWKFFSESFCFAPFEAAYTNNLFVKGELYEEYNKLKHLVPKYKTGRHRLGYILIGLRLNKLAMFIFR